jgi:hypothetical protein
MDFFQAPLKGFVSKREDEFGEVIAGKTYALRLQLYRTQYKIVGSVAGDLHKLKNLKGTADGDAFTMYDGIYGFGRPISGNVFDGASARSCTDTFIHCTPAYYNGYCEVLMRFTPEWGGRPSIADILSGSIYTYMRSGETWNDTADMESDTDNVRINDTNNDFRHIAQQISASINLKDIITTTTPGTFTPQKRWVIQSKFETPVLNFTGSRMDVIPLPPYSVLVAPSNDDLAATSVRNQPQTRGMWHQYGVIPSGSNGIFMEMMSVEKSVMVPTVAGTDPDYLNDLGSLADVVGFSPERQRIGQLKEAKVIEEAVVAIPYTLGSDGRKKFYKLKRRQVNGAIRISRGLTTSTEVPQTVQHVVNSVQKYVFPPKFDFVTMPTVDPLVMYIFEFSKTLTKQDLADIWQNLPPDNTGETFQAATVTIQHSLMTDDFYDESNRKISSDMRWMVFKVKRRAASNYNKYKKKHLTSDLSTIPNSINSRFTYNWPYDYFSLVELVKMDAGIQYASVPGEPDELEPAPDVELRSGVVTL